MSTEKIGGGEKQNGSTWHMVEPQDRDRRCRCCSEQAVACEHVEWEDRNMKGVSFFYYCQRDAAKRGITLELTYEAFLAWHRDATIRLDIDESLAEPSPQFYEHWRKRRIDEARAFAAHERLLRG